MSNFKKGDLVWCESNYPLPTGLAHFAVYCIDDIKNIDGKEYLTFACADDPVPAEYFTSVSDGAAEEPQYMPDPYDTSEMEIPDEVQPLVPIIARNTHELRSKYLEANGWVYGKEHNATLKTNPNLVPYENLNDEEKDCDKMIAEEAIKVIMIMGYDISNNE